jgi:hypothetical protein
VSGGRFDSAYVPRIAGDGKPDDRIVWNLSAGPMTIEHMTINTGDWNGVDDIAAVHERYRHHYAAVSAPAGNQRRWMIDPAKDKDHRIAIRPIRLWHYAYAATRTKLEELDLHVRPEIQGDHLLQVNANCTADVDIRGIGFRDLDGNRLDGFVAVERHGRYRGTVDCSKPIAPGDTRQSI